MSEIVLEIEDLSYVYMDKNKALSDVSFQIERGTKVFFHGANGAGKTTLFQCLNGLLKVKQGTIKIDGKPAQKEKDRMRAISMVFQNANDQIIAGNVFDEVAFGPLNMGLSEDEVILRVENAMKVMNIQHLSNKPPHFLSYGQKKRVTIASILSMSQKIIILDEPTAGLDAKQTEEIIFILDNLVEHGITLLISTHDSEFSFRCADKIIVLHEGELICEGSPEYVFSQNDVLCKASLNKPVIMEIYESLLENNMVKNYKIMPRDKNGLLKIIKREGIYER